MVAGDLTYVHGQVKEGSLLELLVIVARPAQTVVSLFGFQFLSSVCESGDDLIPTSSALAPKA